MFRRQTTICREGWYYLAIIVIVFGGAMLKEVNLLLVLSGMLLGPFLVNWRAVRANLRGLKVERNLPLRVCAGDLLSVDLNLTNTRPRLGCWAVVVEENIQREPSNGRNGHRRQSPPLHPNVLFPYTHAGQSRKGVYRGRLAERGRYRFGPFRASTRFPFGLFSRTITLGQPETFIVLPRLGQLTAAWATRKQEAFTETDRRRRQAGAEGDFFGVREWRGGDGQRLVHWRSSARLGKLVVRQLERPRSRDVAIVLDLWQPENHTLEHTANAELAVSFAATVLSDLCRTGGSDVYLGIRNSRLECIGGPASPATLQQMMEQLALAEAQSADVLPALLAESLRQVAVGTEVVLVTTRPVDLADTERFAELWSDPVLRERSRRILHVDASSRRLAEYFAVDEITPIENPES
jgi:uncharacterized protein (DUF58 family)